MELYGWPVQNDGSPSLSSILLSPTISPFFFLSPSLFLSVLLLSTCPAQTQDHWVTDTDMSVTSTGTGRDIMSAGRKKEIFFAFNPPQVFLMAPMQCLFLWHLGVINLILPPPSPHQKRDPEMKLDWWNCEGPTQRCSLWKLRNLGGNIFF